ncbi:hypothetical protein EST38_g2165 [Candolleomyces aberdarensis]|uniref:Glucose receptor Git3 N-terminal domain-containing protein n=1 Tax=Candolleomyces aberdarensis TaxID=2316362 RepID=A0A4Q2DW96_9AGAR|nr:hypothetical protein EST38_g2165 [Candolleomyces aberdarensis]
MPSSLPEGGSELPNVFSFSQRLEIIFAAQAAALSGISIVVLIVYKLFITAPSTFCYTQGMVQLIGTNIIDWSTLAITLHTFAILVLQWNAPVNIAKYLSLGVLTIVAFIVGVTIGVSGLEIVGPTGLWCWITKEHKAEQLLGEYLWMWTILALTIVFYVIDFLVIRGHVVLEGGFRFRWVSGDRIRLKLAQGDSEERRMATQLLFYPIVYFICIFPFSITRWMTFSGHAVPHEASTFTTCLFSLSGFLNVFLFFKTRPQLITGGPIPEPVVQNQGYQHNPRVSNSFHRRQGQLPPDPEEQTALRLSVISTSGGAQQDGALESEGSDRSYYRDDDRGRLLAATEEGVFSERSRLALNSSAGVANP